MYELLLPPDIKKLRMTTLESLLKRQLLFASIISPQLHQPISCHWALSIPPENIRKGFLMLSGGDERGRGMKWGNT